MHILSFHDLLSFYFWCAILWIVDALPNTTAAPSVPAPLAPALTRRQENYARCVAHGMSYAEAFRQAGLVASTIGSQGAQISELNRNAKVVARINHLRALADTATESTLAERMAWLRLIISADPRELTRIVTVPCGACWSPLLIAEHWLAHFREETFHPDEPRPDAPEPHKPRRDCDSCQGVGIQRVIVTPTDELSPSGRALFMGASQDEKGVIKVQMQDQQKAADMLNKMQSAYVQRTMNLNVNASVHAAKDAAPADVERLFEAFGERPAS
jgi:DNA-binding CsgD family transcriptional regulator